MTREGRSTRDVEMTSNSGGMAPGVSFSADPVERAHILEEPENSPRSIAIEDMPPLLPRAPPYYMEPLCGISLVSLVCAFFVTITTASVNALPPEDRTSVKTFCKAAIFVEAGLAALCVCFLLFGGAGVIERTPQTCYPMPPVVEDLLKKGDTPTGRLRQNIPGPRGHPTMGTYCIRCFVWRPPTTGMVGAHHCNTCQRCVRDFDHHCGVFGRCIVKGNMSCFGFLIVLFPTAFVTMIVAQS